MTIWMSRNLRLMSFLHVILSINDSLQQQIHFNGNIFGNKCYHCNEGSLYSNQPAYPCSLIRVFIVQMKKLCIIDYPKCAPVKMLIRICEWAGLSESSLDVYITKTYLYNFYPLKPHFYIVKLGFTGVYIIFLISAQKHRLWVLVRTASPRRF